MLFPLETFQPLAFLTFGIFTLIPYDFFTHLIEVQVEYSSVQPLDGEMFVATSATGQPRQGLIDFVLFCQRINMWQIIDGLY